MSKHAIRLWWMAVFLAALSALATGCGTVSGMAAVPSEKEAQWQFHDIAGIDLVQKYAVFPPPEGVLIVDSRPYKPKYVDGHIPTAVSMPFSQFDRMTDKLPKDKKALLIFYCEGPT
jgi:hypothetical protein